METHGYIITNKIIVTKMTTLIALRIPKLIGLQFCLLPWLLNYDRFLVLISILNSDSNGFSKTNMFGIIRHSWNKPGTNLPRTFRSMSFAYVLMISFPYCLETILLIATIIIVTTLYRYILFIETASAPQIAKR